MSAIQIAVFNIIYGYAASYLTDLENQRTDSMYEDSMIAKLFMFQFVNSYSSFFYIAFVAAYLEKPSNVHDPTWVGQCGSPDCMQTLAINLLICLGVRLTVGNVQEYVLPVLKQKFYDKKKDKIRSGRETVAEMEFRRDYYDNIKSSIEDYSELLIQFGYMSLFISGLPAAAFVTAVNNYFEIRGDSFKLLKATRRPFPLGIEDIGTMQPVFELMSSIAILTNAGLIVFTMKIFQDRSIIFRFWLFIGFQWIVFALQTLIRFSVPDTPLEVEIQIGRTEFIVRKLIDFEPDDEELVKHKEKKKHDSKVFKDMISAEGPSNI